MARPISAGIRIVELEDAPLEFELRRSSRRTLGIQIKRGGEVVVTSPFTASMDEISRALNRHRKWIRAKMGTLRDSAPLAMAPKWVDGELHPVLGHFYPLHLVRGRPQSVCFSGGRIRVRLRHPEDREKVRTLMEKWTLEEARSFFPKRAGLLVHSIRALGLRRPPPLSYRRMKSRWASCSPKGRILVNTHVLKLPIDLIDYILVHELCHLRHPNHSPAFWAHIDRCMPDWRRRKSDLDSLAFQAVHTTGRI